MSTRSAATEHPHLVPDLRGNAFSLSSLAVEVVVLFPHFVECFYRERVFVKSFSASIEKIMWIFC